MTTRRFHPRSSRTPRRAFALPLVVLLLLIGAMTIGLLMERHSISYHAIARNIDNYRNHHRAAGIKECILRWLDTAHDRVDQSLDSNGLAFSMDVSGEGRIDIFLRDAQGSVLSDSSAVAGRRREIVDDMKFLLDQVPPEQRPDRLFRPVGPVEMSLNSAPELAIRALCLAVVDEPEKAFKAAKVIMDHRGDTQDSGNVADALRDIDLTERQRREIAAMLVARPTLYECLAETRDTSGDLLDKSSGLYLLDNTRSDTFKQGGGFLTWDTIPIN